MIKSGKDYKTMVTLSEERRKKLDFLCEKESRSKANMIAILIDERYEILLEKYTKKKKVKEEEYDDIDKFLMTRSED